MSQILRQFNKERYHIGASLKDLGSKCFRLRRGYGGQVAFTKLDAGEIRRIKKTAFHPAP